VNYELETAKDGLAFVILLECFASILSLATPDEMPKADKATIKVTERRTNDGRLEHAQQMAGHESPRTTKLYDRTKDEITLSEVERIRL
jgi:hypothetical protein